MDLLKSSFKLALARIVAQFVTFFSMIYFARVLGAGELGSYFLLVSIATFLSLITNLGLDLATEKRLSEGYLPEDVFASVVVIKLAAISGISLLVVFFMEELNSYIGEEIAILLIFILFFKSYSSLLHNVLKGELRVGETAEVTVANKLSFAIFGIIFVSIGFNVIGLVISLIFAYLVRLLWLIKKINTDLGSVTKEAIVSVSDYAKDSFIPAVSRQVHNWMDIIIIGYFLTSSAVGAYEIAWQLTAIGLIASFAIGNTIFPQVSKWHTEGEIKKIERVVPNALVPSLYLIIPAFFGTLLLSNEILELIYGTEFAIASSALIILMGGKIIRSVSYVTGNVLYGLDRPELVTRATVVAIVSNLFFNVLLIWQLGLIGAAIGTTLSLATGTTMRIHYLSQIITIHIPWKNITWCVVSATIMSVLIILVKVLIRIESVVVLVAVIFFGALCYFAITMLYSPLRTDINLLIDRLTNRSET